MPFVSSTQMTRGGYTQEGRKAGRKVGQGVFGRIDLP